MSREDAGSAARGFRVEFQEVNGTLLVTCHGRLTHENSPLLRAEMKEKVAREKRIVMDLKEVPQIDSAGLGAVVGLYVTARTRGCKFELVNAGPQVREIFKITNMLSLFEAAGRGGRMM
jgi:anti-anti-sigma factor